MKKFLKEFLKIIIILFLVIPFISLFAAWQEPTQPPPGGNVPAPINVGVVTQYKSGALGIGGLFTTDTNTYLAASGRVGIGTVTPSYKLDVAGSVGITSSLNVDSGTLLVDAINRRVGIGTVTPAYKLDVAGSVGITSSLNADSGTLLVDAINRRVGIGTVTPAYKLDVAGDINLGSTNVYSRGGTAGSSITCATGSTPNGITISGGIITSTGACATLGGGGVTGSGTTDYLAKFTGASAIGNSQIRDNGTNVGIGTAPSSYKLDVAGSVGITSSLNVDSGTLLVDAINRRVGIGTAAPTTKLDVRGGINTDYAGSTIANMASGLFVGGDRAVGARFGLGVQNGFYYQGSNDGFNSNFDFRGSTATGALGAVNVRIQNNGYVGIGTTAPSQRLDVNGYVKGQTGLCIGNNCRTTWPMSGYEKMISPATWLLDGDVLTMTVFCSAGKNVLGGGCVSPVQGGRTMDSYPNTNNNGWTCRIKNEPDGGGDNGWAYAMCAYVN